jgi:hypothetical protein
LALEHGQEEVVISLIQYGARSEDILELKSLDLSGKNIQKIPEMITQLVQLEELNLSNNPIKKNLSIELRKLTPLKIKRLNIEDNALDFLPFELCQLTTLQSLDFLKGNRLDSIPKDILGRSLNGIMLYLKGLQTEKAVWNKIKLMFVGQEAVGKTSLLECFRSGLKKLASPVMNLSTDGIDIGIWKPKNTSLEFVTFDFGGQQILYPL